MAACIEFSVGSFVDGGPLDSTKRIKRILCAELFIIAAGTLCATMAADQTTLLRVNSIAAKFEFEIRYCASIRGRRRLDGRFFAADVPCCGVNIFEMCKRQFGSKIPLRTFSILRELWGKNTILRVALPALTFL